MMALEHQSLDPDYLQANDRNNVGDTGATSGCTKSFDAPRQLSWPLRKDRLADVLEPRGSLSLLRPQSPFQPVDWSWQLGVYLAQQRKGITKDWLVAAARQAHSFVTLLSDCDTEGDHLRLAERHPQKYQALLIRLSDNPLLRAEVEARILADEAHDTIGQRMGLSPKTIDLYEQWFCDVRQRPTNYVLYSFLKIHDFEEWWPTETIWRYWGHRGGPIVLDAVMHEFNPRQMPDAQSEVAGFLANDIVTRLTLRAMVLFHMLPVNQKTAPKILKLMLDFQKRQAKLRQPSLVGAVAENVRTTLDELPWTTKPMGR